jgi:hypothetical protein
MDKKRKVYAPFSLTSEAGVAQTPVEGYIDVNQTIYPTVSTGTINENGTWTGVKSNDNEFIGLSKDLAIAHGADILTQTTIDCANYNNLMFALKVSNAGNYALSLLVSGTETGDDSYYNLKPTNTNFFAYSTLRTDSSANLLDQLLVAENAYDADVWNVVKIDEVKGFKFIMKVSNNSGGNSDIETACMRII